MGLRLGTAVCGPHSCQRCGDAVNALGRHAPSCKRSEGRHQQHAAINAIVKNGLMSAHIPSRLEPTGLMKSDGKRPDGATMAPWKSGCILVWDGTCPEQRRRGRMENIRVSPQATCLHPLPLTLEAIGPRSLAFLKELGRGIRETGEPKIFDYLVQCLSVAVQQGNLCSGAGYHWLLTFLNCIVHYLINCCFCVSSENCRTFH